MKIKVPKKITKQIAELCQDINANVKPVYVPCLEPNRAEDYNSIESVIRKIMSDGGTCQFGWVIWEWPEVMLEAEFWAVWADPDGKLVDVTPHFISTDKILFLPDSNKFRGKPLNSILRPLKDQPLVHDYIKLNEQIWKLTDQYENDDVPAEKIVPLLTKKREMEEAIDAGAFVGRNDLCPCGSGKKFKKCCAH